MCMLCFLLILHHYDVTPFIRIMLKWHPSDAARAFKFQKLMKKPVSIFGSACPRMAHCHGVGLMQLWLRGMAGVGFWVWGHPVWIRHISWWWMTLNCWFSLFFSIHMWSACKKWQLELGRVARSSPSSTEGNFPSRFAGIDIAWRAQPGSHFSLTGAMHWQNLTVSQKRRYMAETCSKCRDRIHAHSHHEFRHRHPARPHQHQRLANLQRSVTYWKCGVDLECDTCERLKENPLFGNTV
jgi:hypothetical protein